MVTWLLPCSNFGEKNLAARKISLLTQESSEQPTMADQTEDKVVSFRTVAPIMPKSPAPPAPPILTGPSRDHGSGLCQ